MYKRTTRTNGPKRNTYTQSTKGSSRSSKMSQSLGSKYSRVTTTTNLNTGERKTYLTERTGDGWVSRKSLSAPKQKPAKFKKSKTVRMKKSKPLGVTGWVVLGIIIILLLASN